MDCIVHEILQARIPEWVAVAFSRRSSQPRDWTQVSHIAGEFFISWATREAWLWAFPAQAHSFFVFWFFFFNYIKVIHLYS